MKAIAKRARATLAALLAENPLLPLAILPTVTCRTSGLNVDLLLAGETHAPVVYFARVGRNVKIGTTTNLRARMNGLYLGLEDLIAVVHGDRSLEAEYHEMFAASHIQAAGRKELFRLDLRLRVFLARWRCRWSEVAAGIGVGSAAAVATGSILLGIVAAFALTVMAAGRLSQPWRPLASGE